MAKDGYLGFHLFHYWVISFILPSNMHIIWEAYTVLYIHMPPQMALNFSSSLCLFSVSFLLPI